MNAREIALEILHKTINDESYSNLLMRKKLGELDMMQRPFATNLINGVLRNYETLNYQFSADVQNISLRNRLILSMALFERFYLKEKDYAVNNEYVSLARNQYDRNFINALLRKHSEFREPEDEDVKANLPRWIYLLLKSQYGPEELARIIETYRRIPEVCYHLNGKKCSYEMLEGIDYEPIDERVFTSRHNLINTTLYRNGYFYIQDYNSSTLWKHLELDKECTLLDVCSAPGSKLFNCLEIVRPENAYANDVHEHRIELVRKMAQRLGHEGINYLCQDGTRLDEALGMRFDRIMLDVPCSGLGVIGRKPDLKFHVDSHNLDELEKLQGQLLDSASRLLKEDGLLLYSTCTLNKKENERQIASFIKRNGSFATLKEETIINDRGDCFYYALLKKVKNDQHL